ncbi:asparagine synthase [Hamiltosporidium magnivora]|uniref:Asparagine synthase n=1 Tax=Hamiltosporidium magnivora TaxID=148818 RepID=A0A4Q9LE80_9MICR|nr:asparagine synthase [Hamiltosporidium magnivora]
MFGMIMSTQDSYKETKEILNVTVFNYASIVNEKNKNNIFSYIFLKSNEYSEPIMKDYILLFNGIKYNSDISENKFVSKIIEMKIFNLNNKNCICDCDIFQDIEKYNENNYLWDKVNNNFENQKNIRFDIGLELTFIHEIYNEINKDIADYSTILFYKNFIYFFKDNIGKKSLGFSIDNGITVSSFDFENEVDPSFLYIYSNTAKQLFRTKKFDFYFSILKNSTQNIFLENETNYVNIIENQLISSMRNFNIKSDCVVFFSGGIDSMILVIILNQILPENICIYLINTSFLGDKKQFDRKMGILAFEELKSKYKNRKFIFIENNIDNENILKNVKIIKNLIFPKKTPMDLNIGMTLFFTAKEASKFSPNCFVGTGADELFGGYKKFRKDITKLKSMIFDEVSGIWDRNLGRDDRLLSYFHIEPFFLFLDKNLIEISLQLPEDMLINQNSQIYGNKYILRKILIKHGFNRVAGLIKKAMQFGSGAYKVSSLIFK